MWAENNENNEIIFHLKTKKNYGIRHFGIRASSFARCSYDRVLFRRFRDMRLIIEFVRQISQNRE